MGKTSFELAHRMVREVFAKVKGDKEVLFGEDFERFHKLRVDVLRDCGWTYPEYMEVCNSNP